MVNSPMWSWLVEHWRRGKKRAEPRHRSPGVDFYDVCIFVGFASMVTGIGLWWLPAALIIGGILLLAFGLIGSAKGPRKGIGGE